MKPKKAYKKIQKILREHREYPESSKTNAMQTILRLEEAMPELYKLLKIAAYDDPDERRGWESYGCDKMWEHHLYHVTDRWRCRFRIQWLIDIVDYVLYDHRMQKELKKKLAPTKFSEELL